MGVPSPRTPVRVARGTYSVLNTNKASLEEGEVCYATDENTLYVKEGGSIESTGTTLLDEDNFASDSNTQGATQQSIKAYADTKAALAGATFTGDVIATNKTFSIDGSTGGKGFYIKDGNGDSMVYMTWDNSADVSILESPTKSLYIESPHIYFKGGQASDEIMAEFDQDADVSLYYNNVKKFETTSGGVTISGNCNVSGGGITIEDDQGAYFGTGNDLEIKHTSGNTTLTNITGELRLDPKSGERGIVLTGDAAVDLYYDNVKKLETTAAGVKVTGDSVGNMTTITYGANVALALTSSAYHKVTLTGNIAFTCTTEAEGQSGSIFITQDGTGSRTASWSTDFKWPGGTAPTLTTTASATDRIDYVVLAANTIHCVATLDVK